MTKRDSAHSLYDSRCATTRNSLRNTGATTTGSSTGSRSAVISSEVSSSSMKDSNHGNSSYTSTPKSRKRRRMQRQPSTSSGIARIISVIRNPTAIIFATTITQLFFVPSTSGFVLSTNILKHHSRHHSSIVSSKYQRHHKSATSTLLFLDTDTSINSTPISPGQQLLKSSYDEEGTISQRDPPISSAMAHYYPSSSRQKKVTSRKIQLRWITQTVQKLIARENNMSNTNAVGPISNSSGAPIPMNEIDLELGTRGNVVESTNRLIEGLELLCSARTQAQVIEAGRMIELANVVQTQSIAIQERIIKATAMTGLLHIALHILDHMVHDVQYLPSPICQDAISNGLRRAGRIQQLNKLLLQLGSIAQPQNKSISLITFNTYLAALCDIVTGKDDATQQQRTTMDTTSLAGYDVADMDYKSMALDNAWHCIDDLDRTKQTMAIIPDSVSYATVIQAAAYIGNQTIVDAVWDKIRTRNIHPNIVAYNARLRSTTSMNAGSGATFINKNGSKGKVVTRLGRQKKRDQEILKVWDTEISSDPYVSSDKYTIDLLLLPLIRSGRVGDVESLLDNFIKRNSESAVSNAFTAFLLTVVAGGELSTARALFEMYILPTLSPVVFGDAGGMIRMVRPTTRHFNVLIEGYRKYYQSYRFTYTNNETTTNMLDTTKQAWSLYEIMTQSLNARPDSYTTTSMMGLCRTSTELSKLLFQSFTKFDIECSSVVLRAALTAFGDLGDASSVIWLFAMYAPTTTRTWNVLLGALAKIAENNESYVIDACASAAAVAFHDSATQKLNARFDIFLQVTNIFDATQMILRGMCQLEKIDGVSAPNPDSQTFCVAASALQYGPSAGSALANSLFHTAAHLGIPADGRFVNAAIRCFGNDIDAALVSWRDDIRPKCITFEKRALSSSSSGKKNLVAAYNGLLYVCGRAFRPDIALRVVYAMNKDDIEPNETSLNSYRSGSRAQHKLDEMGKNEGGVGLGFRTTIERTLKLREQFESLLVVECTKYDQNDRRRDGEQRVRIIL